MPPVVDPVPSDQQLPDSTEVAIIGGGIIGVSAALTLKKVILPENSRRETGAGAVSKVGTHGNCL